MEVSTGDLKVEYDRGLTISTFSRWGPSKTAEDTVKFMKAILPSPYGEGDGVQYRASYAVHEVIKSDGSNYR